MRGIFLHLSFISGVSAADRLLIPIDPQQYRQLCEIIVQAAGDGDNAAVLVGGRHALELVPNDPEMQAQGYLVMSMAARDFGEAALGETYAALAKQLDHSIDVRMRDFGTTGVKRGDAGANIQSAVNVLGQAMSGYQQISLMKMCLDMVKHRMTPPSQYGAQTGAGQPPPQPMPIGQPIGQPVIQPMPAGPSILNRCRLGSLHSRCRSASPCLLTSVTARSICVETSSVLHC
jgi:hypothetical protein